MPTGLPTLPTRPLAPTRTYTVDWTGGIAVSFAASEIIYVDTLDNPGVIPWGAFANGNNGSPAVSLEFGNSPPYNASTLTNAGTIWNHAAMYNAVGIRAGTIVNSGWIIAECDLVPAAGSSGYASGAEATAVQGATNLTNTGTIYAYATGVATGVTLLGLAQLDNSGTIAARAIQNPYGQGNYAFAISSGQPLVHIVNQASGLILAEGVNATAISLIQGTINVGDASVTNHGLIEAVATGAGNRSIAISVGVIQNFEHNEIVNDGTIRGDVAIFAADKPGYNLPVSGLPIPSTQIVHNLTGGLIDGDIQLNLGDDLVTNAGTIVGKVDLGDGWDAFDGTGGFVDGLVDLGIGNDQFKGGSLGDVARGGLGNDDMLGGDGADLLLGDGNDDYLEGGAGNDGLYGGTGDDWLVTLGGDRAVGDGGDDIITTADYTFARIDGGGGFDIWQLAAGIRALDLSAVAASGRVGGIDQLELGTGKSVTIRAADLAAMTDNQFLAITNGSGSAIYLPESWTTGAAVTIAGHKYVPYTHGTVALLIDIDAAVTFGLPAAAGAGLDAVASGVAAPVPGTIAGTALVTEIDSTAGLQFWENQVIDRDTIIRSTSDNFAVTAFGLFTEMAFVNFGTIISQGTNSAQGYYDGFVGTITNHGTIQATTVGALGATGVRGNNGLDVFNHGLITVAAAAGPATGVLLSSTKSLGTPGVLNIGDIIASALAGEARGVSVQNMGDVENRGTISATGSTLAVGVDFIPEGSFNNNLVNSGTITARATGGSGATEIGVRLREGNVTNSGVIHAAVAIYNANGHFAGQITNSGRIEGAIVSGPSWYGLNVTNQVGGTITGSITVIPSEIVLDYPHLSSRITNRGTITGDIHLGSTSDVIDTVGGVINGGVWGGLGNDTYKVDTQALLLFENANEGIDTVESTVSYYLFQNIENLTLAAGAGSIFGVGNDLANVLTGNEGANLLIAGGGDDTVSGGAGNDLIYGQDGADTLNGDAGIDYLVGGAGDDVLHGGDNADALYGEDGNDYLDAGSSFDTDILVGGAGNDTLYAISGQPDPEQDLLDGGSGDDVYWVDTGADLTFEAVGGGNDTVHADVSVANAGVYLYANVENLVLEGTTAFGVGNALDNVLTGSASGNWLLGGLGADTINGKAGNDVLFGEGGADTFVFEAASGADVIGDFTHGSDHIRLLGYYADFAATQSHFVQVGNDGAIDLGDGNLIVLQGVQMATLNAGDFLFV